MNEPTILVCDDSDDDLVLLMRCMTEVPQPKRITLARSGQEAMDYLARATPDRRPALILLDINMPRVSGIHLLSWIRSRAELKATPVVILTTSDHASDRRAAWQAGASSYLVKPTDFDGFLELTRLVVRYWLGVNRPAVDA